MTDERRPDELDEKVEDLDVPPEEGEDVKGGAPSLMQACATGEHIKKVKLDV
jgi:hypothetical protein